MLRFPCKAAVNIGDCSGRAAGEGMHVLDQYAERWAIVTGASSGIGAEFARKLAARGMHLILVARRKQLMEELAADLHTRHGTRCEVIVADLSDANESARLIKEVTARGYPIELLVNNAGFAVVGEMTGTNVERIMEMVRLNVGALTELTYLVLPGMVERGHGAIVNVASVAGFQPVAYMGAYAASKSYVLHFSEAIWAEARSHGVTVMALCPGITRTEFFTVANVAGWLKKQASQSPEQVVKTCLKGLEKKRQYIVSGWKNYILSLLVRLAPRKTAVIESMKFFRPEVATDPKRPQTSSPEDTLKAGQNDARTASTTAHPSPPAEPLRKTR